MLRLIVTSSAYRQSSRLRPDLARADRDNRNDAIVKREIYETKIAPCFDVKLCVDDRPRVIRMYREEIGLRGPARVSLWGEQRDFTWYVRDGYFVRSPVKVNGVAISEAERRKYETYGNARRQRSGKAKFGQEVRQRSENEGDQDRDQQDNEDLLAEITNGADCG